MAFMEYVTLLMLVVTFLQERSSQNDKSIKALRDWLHEKNFQEILKYLEDNKNATQGIEQILENEFNDLQEKIDVLSDTLSTVAAKLEGFEKIVPETHELSDQAISIMTGFAASEGSDLIYFIERKSLRIPRGSTQGISITEPKLLHDDMNLLCNLGWLRRSRSNSSGDPILSMTRKGAKAASILST